mmetsp:Transcript_9324/g.10645  ORF Transcript_9324/g.10645 Transcript_9324/m.10645 type:complete len:110 (+) Transcript_9324:161-490(+)
MTNSRDKQNTLHSSKIIAPSNYINKSNFMLNAKMLHSKSSSNESPHTKFLLCREKINFIFCKQQNSAPTNWSLYFIQIMMFSLLLPGLFHGSEMLLRNLINSGYNKETK